MSKRSYSGGGQSAKRVMRRAPAGTYKTYRQATAMPYARVSSAPQEMKYFDTSFSQNISAVADWTGTEVPCTNYIQSDGTTLGAYTDSALIPSAIGAGYGQINGNKYYLRKLRIKGHVVSAQGQDQADVPVPRSVRIIVVLDKQPQGAQAQGESIFTDMGTSPQANFSFLAMAAGSGGRFQILKDKEFMLQPMAAGTDGANTNSVVCGGANFKCNYAWKKPLAVQLKANSATPTVASLSNYNIFIIAHTTAGTPVTTINGCARAYFTD